MYTSIYSNSNDATSVTIAGSGTTAGGGTSALKYVMSDAQGSARVVMSGNQITARHDYLPFGEEIGAGTGLRASGASGQAYNVTDTNRQKYALLGRDASTESSSRNTRSYFK